MTVIAAEAVAGNREATSRIGCERSLHRCVRRYIDPDVIAVYMEFRCLVGGPDNPDILTLNEPNNLVSDHFTVLNLNIDLRRIYRFLCRLFIGET